MGVAINGKTYHGNSIVVRNNKVIVDGKDVTTSDMQTTILAIKVDGKLENLITDASVQAGLIMGDVQAGGSVTCDDVDGDVQAGGSVSCSKINGDVMAGGSVRHG